MSAPPRLTPGELHGLVKDVLQASTHAEVDQVWNGPRSNEVAITLKDGRHIVLAARESI